MGHPAQPVSKLVLDPAEAGIQQGGVGQDQREQQAANLVKAVLYAHKVLGEVLDYFKKSPGCLTVLEQLRAQVFELGPVEQPHGGGSHGHWQGHSSQDASPLSYGHHLVGRFLGQGLALETWIQISTFLTSPVELGLER